jgi:hypothetical protein
LGVELILSLVRNSDLYMKGIQNARERDEDDYVQLFKSVDSRFTFDGVVRPEGSVLSVISATWEG